jgi:hypothetical protein
MWTNDADLQSTLDYGDPFGHSEPLIREILGARSLARQAAEDVITLAFQGGMPEHYWSTDKRILRACEILGITPDLARDIKAQEWIRNLDIKPKEPTAWSPS